VIPVAVAIRRARGSVVPMETPKFCQSCAMPLAGDTQLGTNADGTLNDEYCSYCYQDGNYTSDMSMDQMIDFCTPFMVQSTGQSADACRAQMAEFFPQLKRWQAVS
jgi:hypothetical protein